MISCKIEGALLGFRVITFTVPRDAKMIKSRCRDANRRGVGDVERFERGGMMKVEILLGF